MLLETKAIIQFALLWGSTWVVASLAIASVLAMALVANFVVSRAEITPPGRRSAWRWWRCCCSTTRSRSAGSRFESRALESLFYAVLEFSPILCAGLLFGSAIKRSTSVARDYGTNLLGAMVGGVAEYASLVTGFRMLLLVIAAVLHRRRARPPGRSRRVTPVTTVPHDTRQESTPNTTMR